MTGVNLLMCCAGSAVPIVRRFSVYRLVCVSARQQSEGVQRANVAGAE